MTDLSTFLLVLAVIYGWECATWVSRGSMAFLNFWGPRWRAAYPGNILGNQQGGVVFANPLPPLGWVALTRQLPLTLSPELVLDFVPFNLNTGSRPAQSGRYWRFAEIQKITVEFKTVRVNGKPFLKAPSPVFAQYLAAVLQRLRSLPEAGRAGAIRKIYQAGFDTKALEQRWQDFQTAARPLRWVANGLFACLFLAAPTAVWLVGLKMVWPWLLAALLGLGITAAVQFRRVHRIFFPAAEDERFTHFIVIMLSPATAVRAHDILARHLFECFHPLAAARVFCSPESFHEFARQCWREVSHPAQPLCPIDSPFARTAESFSRELFRDELADFLRQQHLPLQELSRPPKPTDATCRSYCARCETQFTTVTGECADCGGLPLIPFSTGT